MAARNTPLKTRLSTLSVAFLLTVGGCSSDDEESSSFVQRVANEVPAASAAPTNTVSPDTVYENRITGSVGDGPIVGARLRVFANSGALLAESVSGANADYELTIKTQGRNYALSIEADQGTDLVTGMAPDFKLTTAIHKPSKRSISNINPFSTLIFESARRNGGVNDSTVAAAKNAVTTNYGFGLDTALLPDPVETSITDENVHLIVKSSETLGEMIRRTRDALIASGQAIDGDGVVTALSADLVDGWIDGMGAIESNSRLAAVANVASAAVLVEAMSNELLVYGNNSTAAMDNSIRQIRPSTPATSVTGNVTIPASAFEHAARVLRAAQLVDPDPVIAATLEVIESAEPDLAPETLAARLPSGIQDALRRATTTTAYASDDTIDAVNLQARSTSSTSPPVSEPEPEPTPPPPEPEPEPAPEPPPPEPEPEPTPPPPEPEPEPTPEPPPPPANNPPVISGSPSTTTVEVGTPWSFTPSASDPDGDSLTFSVTGAPSWMSFSSSTGRLSGTPGSANVGTFTNIRISVSDGQASATLAAFSLTVTSPPPPPPPPVTGSAVLSWAPPTERTDGSSLPAVGHYTIYYGQSATTLDLSVTVDGSVTSVEIGNLSEGAWHFAITATDSDGLESARSGTVSKTIG